MEKFISELKSAADKVVKKTGELAEISKVKLNAANAKSDINACFKTLGELVYKAQKEQEDDAPEKIQELIETIDALYKKIDELNDSLAAMKNEKLCPNCGKSNPKKQRFCGGCGQQFDADDSDDGDDTEVYTDVEVV